MRFTLFIDFSCIFWDKTEGEGGRSVQDINHADILSFKEENKFGGKNWTSYSIRTFFNPTYSSLMLFNLQRMLVSLHVKQRIFENQKFCMALVKDFKIVKKSKIFREYTICGFANFGPKKQIFESFLRKLVFSVRSRFLSYFFHARKLVLKKQKLKKIFFLEKKQDFFHRKNLSFVFLLSQSSCKSTTRGKMNPFGSVKK